MTAPPISTRQPTGKAPWPTVLLAGVEGSGKSVRAALASASSMIHRTFWIGCGEDDPDEYGIYPGVRFEIVNHDGTYRGILAAAEAAARQDRGPNGEPNLIVLDSGSRFWNLLHDVATETMIERLHKRAAKSGRAPDYDPATLKLTPDLWNTARDRWYHVLDTLRYEHQGPVIITSRLKMTTVFENGEPTKIKEWDQKAQYDLPYDVGVYVQLRASYPARDDWVVRVKSARYEHPVDEQGKPKAQPLAGDWTVETLWRSLGLTEPSVVAPVAQHHQVVGSGAFDTEDHRRTELLDQILAAARSAGVDPAAIKADWATSHNGQPIHVTTDFGGLELLRDDLKARPLRAAEPDPVPEAVEPTAAAQEATPAVAEEAPGPDPWADGSATARGPKTSPLDEVLEEIAAATTVDGLRYVWKLSGQLHVRDTEVDDPQHGRISVGKLIMARQRQVAGGTEPDHARRAAGDAVEVG